MGKCTCQHRRVAQWNDSRYPHEAGCPVNERLRAIAEQTDLTQSAKRLGQHYSRQRKAK